MTRPDTLARMASDRVLWAAWSRVAAGSGIAGTDGITTAEFARGIGPRLAQLARLLTDARYRPQPLRPLVALRGAKARVRAVPTVCDRVVQRAFLTVCAPALSDRAETSYAYRPGRSWLDAVARAQQHRDAGLRWVLRTDIDDFFATIDHTELARSVAMRITDPGVVNLVNGWAAAPLLTADGLSLRRRGLPEGAPVSPLLAELYLTDVDTRIHRRYGQLVRYADDIAVFCSTRDEAVAALGGVKSALASRGLRINTDKTYVASFAHGFDLLGWHFQGERAGPAAATPPAAASTAETR